MLKLKKEDYEKILDHCRKGLPNESCGLLGGTIEGDVKTIEKVYLLTNIDESNEHFSMDPKEQLSAIKDIRQNGYQMIGNFHSHPESPSRPSEEDKRLAFDPNIEYLILSLMDADIRCSGQLQVVYLLRKALTETPDENENFRSSGIHSDEYL